MWFRAGFSRGCAVPTNGLDASVSSTTAATRNGLESAASRRRTTPRTLGGCKYRPTEIRERYDELRGSLVSLKLSAEMRRQTERTPDEAYRRSAQPGDALAIERVLQCVAPAGIVCKLCITDPFLLVDPNRACFSRSRLSSRKRSQSTS